MFLLCGVNKGLPSSKNGLSTSWTVMAGFPTCSLPEDWVVGKGEADNVLEATGMVMVGLRFKEEGETGEK